MKGRSVRLGDIMIQEEENIEMDAKGVRGGMFTTLDGYYDSCRACREYIRGFLVHQ